MGALVAGLVIAETEYRNEVEVVIEPFKGLALGVFLITVGMRIDLGALIDGWPMLLGALAGVMLVKAIVTGVLLKMAGAPAAVAARDRHPDGQPVGNHADRAGRGRAGGDPRRGHRQLLVGRDRDRPDPDAAAGQPRPVHGAAGSTTRS